MKNSIPLLAFALSSCATIVAGDTSTVSVTSEPSGAHFTTSIAGVSGTTPTTVVLPNGQPVHFTFTMDGYDPVAMESKPTQSAWIAGNLLFGIGGLIIGGIVDGTNPKTKVHKKPIAPVLTATPLLVPEPITN